MPTLVVPNTAPAAPEALPSPRTMPPAKNGASTGAASGPEATPPALPPCDAPSTGQPSHWVPLSSGGTNPNDQGTEKKRWHLFPWKKASDDQ
jgi:hypothetical protein